MNLSKEQIQNVKAKGFLQNRGTTNFSGRVVSVAGEFSADDLYSLAECAKIYGSGNVIFTSRLAAEIVGIPYDRIEDAIIFMEQHNLHFGGTGAKVRPITACKGTTCVYGNIDTRKLAKIIHNRFYIELGNIQLPHKFKIGIGGCPNSCMKPSLNDVGIEGVKEFNYDINKCHGCKTCQVIESCPSKAVTIENNKAIIDYTKCSKCGVCVGKCPFDAFSKDGKSMCKIYVGGTWGKTQRIGTPLNSLYEIEEIPTIIEKIMFWYKENGKPKERLGATIDRIGLEALESQLYK